MTTANRGKKGEALFRAFLTGLATQQGTAFMRLPDAHAGSIVPTVADFLLVRNGVPHFIEVKETSHDFRLPHGNFDKDQVSRMWEMQLAGAKCSVFTYHSGLALWRKHELDTFKVRTGGSWNFSDIQPKQLKDLGV